MNDELQNAFSGTKPVSPQHAFDEARLIQWLRPRMEGLEGEVRIAQFKGGQSNPTFLLSAGRGDGERRFVLRRKPPGQLLPSAHAVDREFRVISALAGSAVPPLAPRARTAHKGSFGHVLVIGGDRGFGGAALLSAESALRAGAGLVSLATRPEHLVASLARLPEVMCQPTESTYQLPELCARADVLVVGPGLGQQAWGRSLLSAAAASARPQVWDADALNLLAAGSVELPADSLITPHPGEAARLLGITTAEVQADRPAQSRRQSSWQRHEAHDDQQVHRGHHRREQ